MKHSSNPKSCQTYPVEPTITTEPSPLTSLTSNPNQLSNVPKKNPSQMVKNASAVKNPGTGTSNQASAKSAKMVTLFQVIPDNANETHSLATTLTTATWSMPKTLSVKCPITKASTLNVPPTKGTLMEPSAKDANCHFSGISTKTIADNATKDFTSKSQPANAFTSPASRNTRRTSMPLKTFTTTGTLRRSKDKLRTLANRPVQVINRSLTRQPTNASTAADRLTCLIS